MADLEAYVPGEQPRDDRIVKLNTNEHPLDPPVDLADLVARLPAGALRRYPDPQCTELRSALAGMHGCDPDRILVGNGSDEILAMCLRAFVEPGERVAYFRPSYSLYPVLCRIHDAVCAPVELDDSFRWTEPPMEGWKVFFLTNPNAPTGMLFPREKVERLCERGKGVVIIDEAYVDFASEDCLDLALRLPNTIVTRSFSKSYALAGIRLGYAVGPKALIEGMTKIKDSYNVNVLTQEIGLEILRRRDRVEAAVERIKRTRSATAEALRSRGFEVAPSETNFLWVRHPSRSGEFLFQELRKRDMLVRRFAGDNLGDHVRVTIGTDEEMNRLIEALDESMKS